MTAGRRAVTQLAVLHRFSDPLPRHYGNRFSCERARADDALKLTSPVSESNKQLIGAAQSGRSFGCVQRIRGGVRIQLKDAAGVPKVLGRGCKLDWRGLREAPG
jgi:hypothetical protein